MAAELALQFTSPAQVLVRLTIDGETRDPATVAFAPPIPPEIAKELGWYFEVYAARYISAVDRERAGRLEQRLPALGADLWRAVFADDAARRLADRFLEHEQPGRLLTVSSDSPRVLAQPWEMLHVPGRTFLFREQPRIAIRRRVAGAAVGFDPYQPQPKPELTLLMVISRPDGAGFLDPRADARAVLDALDRHAPGRVRAEFLRPATIAALQARLDNDDLPHVDVLHFDGHGIYDESGRIAAGATASGRSIPGLAEAGLRWQPGEGGGQGYLLFQNADHSSDPVAAEDFGMLLHRQKVGLVVLSACQSATIGGEDPMGSVAARLTRTGIPSVLAMTQTVLVATTQKLFDQVYAGLAQGRSVGTALEAARGHLLLNRERGERRLDGKVIQLELSDWFLPALYQPGRDGPLLQRAEAPAEPPDAAPDTGLRDVQESGFHGRARELWTIERWFAAGTRRAVIAAIAGQGKTYLAEEAARWLLRTGMFAQACFVDFKAYQGSDPLGLAIATLGARLGTNLLDAAAAGAALSKAPTLLILDNFEAVQGAGRQALLDAAAQWSTRGSSRVLVTTRGEDLAHPAWPTEGSNLCRYLALGGLEVRDALAWHDALMRLPPEPTVPTPDRDALGALYARVRGHPLAVGVLARQLRSRRLAEVGERLEALLAASGDDLLGATLNLALERLSPEARAWLPRIGVFAGGATEVNLLAVCSIEEADWLPVRALLAQAGLLTVETIAGYGSPFLAFHPALSPMLFARLDPAAQAPLLAAHRTQYAGFADFLYSEESRHVAVMRALGARELPNLMAAVQRALAERATGVVNFVDSVCRVLDWFSLSRDRKALLQQAAAIGPGAEGDDYMLKTRLAEELMAEGKPDEALALYRAVLEQLGPAPSNARCSTLLRIAGALTAAGQPRKAEEECEMALEEASGLPDTPSTQRLRGMAHAEMAKALLRRQEYDQARDHFGQSLAAMRAIGDLRGEAVALGNLATVDMESRNFQAAEAGFRETLRRFQAMAEPGPVGIVLHQMGNLYAAWKRPDDAEKTYREAIRIRLDADDTLNAGASMASLANLLCETDPAAAEEWYRKALPAFPEGSFERATTLHNLAQLLADQPARRTEARQMAEAALALKRALDPTACEIWKTLRVLAQIATADGRDADARALHRERIDTYGASPRGREQLLKALDLAGAVAGVVRDGAAPPELEAILADREATGWTKLVAALRRVLAGERDLFVLLADLDNEDAMIVDTALRGIADPLALSEQLIRINGPAATIRVRAILDQHAVLIRAVVTACADPDGPARLAEHLSRMEAHGWTALVGAIRRVLAGERDAAALTESLDVEDSFIVGAVLTGLDDPALLARMLNDPPPA
jgi:tetratricopeptide (TPR) repeat protein